MEFELIVACDATTGGIGCDGKLPWYLPGDLKRFRKVTSDAPVGKMNAVIMGRRTWESLPDKSRPLPGRLNVILTTRKPAPITMTETVRAYASFEEALRDLATMPRVHKVFVIGGAQLYERALRHRDCKTVHLTIVHRETQVGELVFDAWFPLDTVLGSDAWISRKEEYTVEDNCEYLVLNRAL